MICKQSKYADAEHDRDEEEKQQVKAARLKGLYLAPELDKVLGGGQRYEQTIHDRVAEKQQKELVVAVAYTVIYPWTVMILKREIFIYD
jgi:hypothetical protein